MESIYEVLKENIEFIISLFSIIIVVKNFITFITSKPLERQLFSKEKKLFYDFINVLFLFIIAPTFLFSVFFNEKWVISLFSNLFTYLLILLAFQSLIIIIKKLIVKVRIRQVVKLKVFLFNQKFELVSFILIYLNTLIIFGSMNASLVIETMDFKARLILITFCIVFELQFVYTIIIWGQSLKLTKPILVSIKLEDGTTYENYYIYNPSDKNFILIGKDKNPDLYETPILIKVDKIISCQQVNSIIPS